MGRLLFSILISCLAGLVSAQENIGRFNTILGPDKAEAFDLAAESFQEFLNLNYSNENSITQKTAHFLEDYKLMYSDIDPQWNFPNDIKKVLEFWEASGLRKEIRLWPNEHYIIEQSSNEKHKEIDSFEIVDEIIPIGQRDNTAPQKRDSSLYFNQFGLYIKALEWCCSSDTLIEGYIQAKRAVGDISPALMANSYSDFGERLNDLMITRIIVAELYIYMIFSEIKNAED